MVNGQGPFDFILGTGNAAVPFRFSRALAQQFGIAAGDAVPDAYAVGPEKRALHIGPGGSTLHRRPDACPCAGGPGRMLEGVSEATGLRIDGNIGYQFLKDFRVTIDYERSLLRLADGEDPASDNAAGVPFETGPRRPPTILPALVNGTGPYRFVVDTSNRPSPGCEGTKEPQGSVAAARLLVREGGYAGQLDAGEEFERCPAAGGDVCNLRSDTGRFDGLFGISAAHHGSCS